MIYNGIATKVTVQSESSLNGSGTGEVYNLTGKVQFNQSRELVNNIKTVNVWRRQQTNLFAGGYYSGALEMELGFNPAIALLLAAFFETTDSGVSEVGDGAMIFGEGDVPIFGEGDVPIMGISETLISTKELRPQLLAGFGSLKIGTDYTSESFIFSGVVIDEVAIDLRRNQVPKITFRFKAIARNAGTLTATQTPVLYRAHHVNSEIKLDDAVIILTEASLRFSQRKLPARFNTAKAATLFTSDAISIGGQLVEYFGSGALLPNAIVDQADHSFFFKLTDPSGTDRKLEINLPRVIFNNQLPDVIGREDLICRGNLVGLMDSVEDSDGPKLTFVS